MLHTMHEHKENAASTNLLQAPCDNSHMQLEQLCHSAVEWLVDFA